MSKARIKLVIFFAAIPPALLILFVGFRALSGVIALFNSGANPASIFHGAELKLPDADQARWLPDAGSTGETPSDAQREAILAAYWGAWEALVRASVTGSGADLPTYWAGGAYALLDPTTRGVGISADHKIRLRYLSDDGTIAALDDFNFVLDTDLGIRASASSVMTLDNGYWRIRYITINLNET